MSTTNELEVLLKRAIMLLHSPHSNSAAELRLMLDEEIKKRYGPEKTLSNTLTKKQLEDEANFPGRAATPPPQPPETEEIINLTHSPAKTISDSPDSDDGGGAIMSGAGEDDGNLKEFGDLNCCVCGEMMFTATNRLIECSKCGALYHQECHKPPITDEEASEDQGHNWQCDTCVNKPTSSKAAGIVVIPEEPMLLVATATKSKSSATSSRSSSSSNSSSPFYKVETAPATTSTKAATSSSKAQKEERCPTSSNSSKTTAQINVVSSSSSSKKSHSSSKSKTSSKHHENKRKSSK